MAVAERMTGLTRRRIRYYEKVGLLEPSRTEGNRRLYSQADLRRLVEIKKLLEEGLNLQGIGALLSERGPSAGQGWTAKAADAAVPRTGAGSYEAAYPGMSSPERRLEMYEEARARLLGRGPGGSADRLFPSDSQRLTGPRGRATRSGGGPMGGAAGTTPSTGETPSRAAPRPSGPLDRKPR